MSYVALLFTSLLGFQSLTATNCPLSSFCKSIASFADCLTAPAAADLLLAGGLSSGWVSFTDPVIPLELKQSTVSSTLQPPAAVDAFLSTYKTMTMLIEDLGIVDIDTAWKSGRNKLQLIVSPRSPQSAAMASITLTTSGDTWTGYWRATLNTGRLQEGQASLRFSADGSASGQLILEDKDRLVSIC